MKWKPSSILFACLLLGGTTGILIRMSVPAHAASCFVDYYKNVYAKDTSRRAVRVQNPGMTVFDASDESCTRISSLGIVASTGNFAEVGWYEDPTGDLAVCEATNVFPVVMVYAVIQGSVWGCKPGTEQLTGGDIWSFQTSDENQDTVWDYYFNGSYEGSYDLTFTQGQPQDNGERHSTASTNHAKSTFDGLQYSSGTNFTAWTDPLLPSDNDSGYKLCEDSATRTRVIPQSSSC